MTDKLGFCGPVPNDDVRSESHMIDLTRGYHCTTENKRQNTAFSKKKIKQNEHSRLGDVNIRNGVCVTAKELLFVVRYVHDRHLVPQRKDNVFMIRMYMQSGRNLTCEFYTFILPA